METNRRDNENKIIELDTKTQKERKFETFRIFMISVILEFLRKFNWVFIKCESYSKISILKKSSIQELIKLYINQCPICINPSTFILQLIKSKNLINEFTTKSYLNIMKNDILSILTLNYLTNNKLESFNEQKNT